jgi:antirestriction protein ArdC
MVAAVAGRPVSRPRRAAGKAYRGVNVLMLWAAAMEKGYNCPLWLTYKQAAGLGGQVRKGEKGSLVVYADTITKKDTDANGAEVETEIPFMKGYTVFNAEQIDGLPAHFYATAPPLNSDIERLESVESFFASTRASIQHGGSSAFYSPAATSCRCRSCRRFATAKATTPPSPMK